MNRRDILASGLSLLVPSRAAFALPAARTPRLGMFNGANVEVLERLATHGYVEGRNLEVERVAPWSGDREKLDASVRKLLAWTPDVIITSGTFNTRTAQRATATIPIVFINVADPISAGFVKSLSEPGGNITGVSQHNLTLWPKRLELIRELLPKARRVAVIMDGTFARDGYPLEFYREVREVAQRLGLELIEADVAQSQAGFDEAFLKRVADLRTDIAMPLGPWPNLRMANPGWEKRLQDHHRLPVLGFWPRKGTYQDDLLVQLGVPPEEMWDMGAALIARILGGTRPAEIPVQQCIRVDLVINLKAARTLGITVPKEILKRADRVIE